MVIFFNVKNYDKRLSLNWKSGAKVHEKKQPLKL